MKNKHGMERIDRLWIYGSPVDLKKMWFVDIYHMNWLQRMLWRMAMRVINWLHRNDDEPMSVKSDICLSQCCSVNDCLSEQEVSENSTRECGGEIIDPLIGRDEYRIEKEDFGFYYELWLTTKDRAIRPPCAPKTCVIYEFMSRTLVHERQVQFQLGSLLSHDFWFEKIKMIPCAIKSETAIPKWLAWLLPAQLHLYFFVDKHAAEMILSGRRWSIPHKCQYLVEHMMLSSNG